MERPIYPLTIVLDVVGVWPLPRAPEGWVLPIFPRISFRDAFEELRGNDAVEAGREQHPVLRVAEPHALVHGLSPGYVH